MFQERVAAICKEEENITKRIFDLRREAASVVGSVEMFQLSQEIEGLLNRQQMLLQEKDDHERYIK